MSLFIFTQDILHYLKTKIKTLQNKRESLIENVGKKGIINWVF